MEVCSAVSDVLWERANHHRRLAWANQATNAEHTEAHAEDARRWRKKTIISTVIGLGSGGITALIILIVKYYYG
jgi:cysteine synthase